MASGENPASRMPADGLPTELVILASASDPVSLPLQAQIVQVKEGPARPVNAQCLDETVEEEEVEGEAGKYGVEFCPSIEEGITMVPGISQYGSHEVDVPERNVNEAMIVQWLREILVEDYYGKVDCKIMIALIQKEFGSKKRKTRSWLKRAFPKSYLRRSDRNRWFCGISLRADQGKMAISAKDKDWIDKAVTWLHATMEMNPTGKERCSDVHHALTQQVGQASVHMAISAVKMVFPNIPRKTFTRIAFYVGIRFKDSSRGHSSVQSAASTLNSLSSIKTEYGDSAANKLIVAWLQKALVADHNRRERIKLIRTMIKKRFGKDITETKVARLVKKAHPSVDVRVKGSIDGLVWGIRIDSAFRPQNSWLQKAVTWLRCVIEPTDSSYCENAGPIFDLISEKLGLEKPSKCVLILREAIPTIQIKDILGCQVIFGVKLRANAGEVGFPEFNEEDLSQVTEFLELDDGIPMNESCDPVMYEEEVVFPVSNGPLTSTSVSNNMTTNRPLELSESSKQKGALEESNSDGMKSMMMNNSKEYQRDLLTVNAKISELHQTVMKIADDMSTVKKEVEKLVKDNAKSSQQKDSLIIQLQQTLIMLCQQQLQKFIPGSEQNFSEQTLSTLLQKGLLNQSDSSEV